MSGEALNSTQSMPLPLTAMEDCVRAWARMVPLRSPSQFGQLQFHCGNPPPARGSEDSDSHALLRLDRGWDRDGGPAYPKTKAPLTGAFVGLPR